MKTIISLVAVAVLVTVNLAKPIVPLAPKVKAKPIRPDIAMESNWGTIRVFGDRVVIAGHEQWNAEGVFRPDGKVFVMWVEASGRRGPGVYEITNDQKLGTVLQGHWGYEDAVEVGQDGWLVRRDRVEDGRISGDTIFALKGHTWKTNGPRQPWR
jgi:hypothetical protein